MKKLKYLLKDWLFRLPFGERVEIRKELMKELGIGEVMLSRYVNTSIYEGLEFDTDELTTIATIMGRKSIFEVFTDDYNNYLIEKKKAEIKSLERIV